METAPEYGGWHEVAVKWCIGGRKESRVRYRRGTAETLCRPKAGKR